MSFQPVIVGSGLVGWQFLKATQDTQRQVFEKSADLVRDTDYFKENIGQIKTAEDLVSDRRLLRVALGAFGLQDDINNKFFIRKILEEGGADPQSLANKLSDDRYGAIASAFAFDSPVGARTQLSYFGDEIVAKYREQSFEVAVGDQDDSLRLALNFQRSLPELAEGSGGNDTKWFKVMGTTALRTVFETAMGLPSGFGQLDIDQQLEVFRDKAQSRFGVTEVSELADPEVMEKVVQTYLLQTQVQDFSQSSAGLVALSLLQSIPRTSLLG
ncbi:DUF1217 domain-containing protein [Tropicibacter oceani]|uniref:DUF1217 domain-containing protein n=1 Tax=Tropicibacter oceani TaxID=3058420 RepID=A0ABY8QL23_9RHOB|nr:DUF1217 domain-containing protein [Tropicibacter oceani]WGW04668.1 DUF1217 domain-containing protein [Tropicibacter oceani]